MSVDGTYRVLLWDGCESLSGTKVHETMKNEAVMFGDVD